ncbi:LysM peptidoglycan-binding domain-containing protein [Aeromonas sp. 2HA2]|uniref:N-acetylmuramoyl-L-alanine amidase n=3 Tax=Bacteria TaxID=2 RepID=A0AAU6U3Y3_UNCXX|nr:N-acetylmuramoyl-L-alanine amidase [Aeromonas salmonicida]ELI6430910.1 N-acetylmuramoyl-L-alanine amidase [Aeromonas salmonicida subsp. salmonicida]MDF2410417.1 LysM peptidoglycan-binding domain-containing protein [Aeromonas sp. 2HA2]MDM5099908.1 N-acetylmuramoyl-L-alanine amidase [Aeromonas salmonicida]HDX8381565.1 N-acetylmuramoyl-L-alanine amidase [Aeromonas salmonicida]
MRLILVIALSLMALPSWANQLKSVRVWPSPDNTRVVLDMSSAPNYNYFTLTGPDRLVIDLKGANNVANLARIGNNSELVRKIRESSPLEKGGLRLVLDLSSTIKPVVFPLAPAGPYGHRLVIDLPYEEKRSAAAVQATPVGGKGKGVVIAIDPGHGGEDPGSIGPRRTYEKRVTLAVSQKLAALIDREPGMRAVLTRRGDYFVDLNKRSEIARKAKADLLVSVHADSFHNSTPRGASVWVLSTNRANREMGSWLEKQEKQGELLGGVGKVLAESDPNPYLAQTFLDLSMDKSRAEGYDVSRQILRSMGKVARLHKKAPEHASLAVLKAPDIPSVLVETGFISNHAEEKLLATPAYQDKLARAIFEGIRNYYRAHPTKGALLSGKGQASRPAATTRPAPVAPQSVSQPRQVQSQPVVTNKMPATARDGGAATSSGAGVIKPYSAAAQETGAPVSNVGDYDKSRMLRHVVKRGESLSRLAERHGVSQSTLVEINQLRSRDIQIGQTIYIPQQGQSRSAAPVRSDDKSQMIRHVVKRGESLSRLAEKNGVSQARLVEINKLKSRDIQVGQVLYIPQN